MFTDRPLAGNPLAIFLDAEGLSDAEMQALAREMNLSETGFVLPPTPEGRRLGAAYRLRIFTPGLELPFAGHPVIGAAWVLADEGRIPLDVPETLVRQEIAAGVLPVRIAVRPADDGSGRPTVGEVTMTQEAPELVHELDDDEVAELAETLEVALDAIAWPGTRSGGRRGRPGRPAVISTGLPHLVVPIVDRETLEEIERERAPELGRLLQTFGSDSAVLIAPGSSGAVEDGEVSARVFDADRFQIAADPATGAAAGPVVVFLADLLGVRGVTHRVVIEQGVEVKRPSRLIAEVDVDRDGRPGEVRVAGMSVPVAEGVVTLPE